MDINSAPESLIKKNVIKACPIHRDRIDLWFGPLYNNPEDGRDILIRFFGNNYDVPQFEIMSDYSNPIIGLNVVYNSTVWIPYDPSVLFYEPVPFEFLYTQESEPQVIVNVAGIEAVCSSLDCGY